MLCIFRSPCPPAFPTKIKPLSRNRGQHHPYLGSFSPTQTYYQLYSSQPVGFLNQEFYIAVEIQTKYLHLNALTENSQQSYSTPFCSPCALRALVPTASAASAFFPSPIRTSL